MDRECYCRSVLNLSSMNGGNQMSQDLVHLLHVVSMCFQCVVDAFCICFQSVFNVLDGHQNYITHVSAKKCCRKKEKRLETISFVLFSHTM